MSAYEVYRVRSKVSRRASYVRAMSWHRVYLRCQAWLLKLMQHPRLLLHDNIQCYTLYIHDHIHSSILKFKPTTITTQLHPHIRHRTSALVLNLSYFTDILIPKYLSTRLKYRLFKNTRITISSGEPQYANDSCRTCI